MKAVYLIPLTLLLSGQSYAALDEPGFSGEISAITGYSSSTSNTDAEVKSGELSSSEKSESGPLFEALGQIRYTFGEESNHQLFFGTSRDDLVEGVYAVELGYMREVGEDSALSFSYLPTIIKGNTWEDPYLTNTRRKETEVSGNAFRVQYSNLFDTGLSADVAYYNKNIKNDKMSTTVLATNTDLLQREGTGFYTGLSLPLPLTESSMLEASIDYQNYSADGKAMSFDAYGIGLTCVKFIGDHAFSIHGDYSKKNFAALNPVFLVTQQDSEFGVNLAYEYEGISGWEEWGVNAALGFSENVSNINYYDTKDYYLGLGLTRKL
jgi:hypothetical protein